MVKRILWWWPALVCSLLYLSVVYLLVQSATCHTHGTFVYPLDDTYIHCAIAKNTVRHHVWGVTPEAFTSSTTSPIWTALLAAGFLVCGSSILLPLILNLVIGIVLIFYLYYLFRTKGGTTGAMLLLFVIVAAIPLPSLSLLGMEHVLHILVTIAVFTAGVRVLSDRNEHAAGNVVLLVLGALIPMIRYEGVFLIAVLCLFLFLQKRYRFAFALAGATAVPLLLYGLFSVKNGWFPLPNSVLLKGHRPMFMSIGAFLDTFGVHSVLSLMENACLSILFMAAIAAYTHCFLLVKVRSDSRRWPIVLYLPVLLLHLQYAGTGWLFRYEAYLIALGIVVILPELKELLSGKWKELMPLSAARLPFFIPVVCSVALCFPFGKRSFDALVNTPRAMVDRYDEHLPVVNFLNDFYARSTIVVNDIGMIAYMTDCRILDMYGLGSIEPVHFRFSKTGYGKKELAEWANRKQAAVAIVQIQWENEVLCRIPDNWIQVAQWEIPRNVVFFDRYIGFYALDAAAAAGLADHLAAFATKMPHGVRLRMNGRSGVDSR